MAIWKHILPWKKESMFRNPIGNIKEVLSKTGFGGDAGGGQQGGGQQGGGQQGGGQQGGGGFGDFRKQLSKMYGGKKNLQKAMMGTDPRLKKIDTLSHGQKNLQKYLLQNQLPNLPQAKNNPNYQAGGSYLQNLLGQQPQDRYQQLEAPYMRQFNQEIMPGIAEQYAGAGALNSSGFQNAAASAGQSLMERLASLNLNQQNIFRGQQLQGVPMAQSYSQQPYNEQYGRRQIQQGRWNLGMGTPAFGYQNIPGHEGFRQGIYENMGMGMGGGGGGGGINPMSFIPGFGGGVGGGGGGPFGDTSKGGIGGMKPMETAGSIGGGLVGSAFGGPLGGMAGSWFGKTVGGWF